LQSTSKLRTSEKLLNLAKKRGVRVLDFPLPETGCCEVQIDGECAVGIDPEVSTEAERTVMLAHGLGHAVRGELYNLYSPFDVRKKHERRADEWAIRKTVPATRIKKAVRQGLTEPWQIAEAFGVTVPFAEKALRYYYEK